MWESRKSPGLIQSPIERSGFFIFVVGVEPMAGRFPQAPVYGGGSEIRTHGCLATTVVFKTTALNHSAIPPQTRLPLYCTLSRILLEICRRIYGFRELPRAIAVFSMHYEMADRVHSGQRVSLLGVRRFGALPLLVAPHGASPGLVSNRPERGFFLSAADFPSATLILRLNAGNLCALDRSLGAPAREP